MISIIDPLFLRSVGSVANRDPDHGPGAFASTDRDQLGHRAWEPRAGGLFSFSPPAERKKMVVSIVMGDAQNGWFISGKIGISTG